MKMAVSRLSLIRILTSYSVLSGNTISAWEQEKLVGLYSRLVFSLIGTMTLLRCMLLGVLLRRA
jgi:hypothetical protein